MSNDPSSAPTLARVRQIEAKKLFGLYDHRVPLNLDERVTIVHGANGVGKTVLLKLLHALFSKDYMTLLSVPYGQLTVTLVDGSKMQVTPTAQPVAGVKVTILTPDAQTTAEFEVRTDQFAFQQWAARLAQRSAFLHQMGPDRFYDPRTEATYTAQDLWRVLGADSGDPLPLTVAPTADFQRRIAAVKTYLVEAQRLMRLTPHRQRRIDRAIDMPIDMPLFSPAVMVDAQEISSRMRDAFSEYGRISQRLDQTFPQRLFEWRQTMSLDAIKSVLGSIEVEQAQLAKLGVLDPQPAPYQLPLSALDNSDTAKLDAMGLFVTDGKEKLKPLAEFASRIEPLLSNINAKFKNKTMRLDRERGLIARAADGAEVRPDQLSSGEQHEMVMLYHLLFRVSPNTLVLIDEPELSLHIDWQRRFLPELLEIAKRTGIDALVATHSPSIVGERSELMIDLESSQSTAADPMTGSQA